MGHNIPVTNNNKIKKTLIFQERFVLINDTVDANNTSVWWIPVSYTTAAEKDFESTRPKLWLRGERSIVVENITIGESDWFIGNIQQTGENYFFGQVFVYD